MNRIGLLFLAMVLSTVSTVSSAKNDSAKASDRQFYQLFDDGGEHPASECDTTRELPKKLKKEKNIIKFDGYIGSEQIEFAEKNDAGIDAWMHYFSTSMACGKALKTLNKNY